MSFPTPEEKNTTASKLSNHVQHAVKKQRMKALIELGENKLREFARQQIGKKYFRSL